MSAFALEMSRMKNKKLYIMLVSPNIQVILTSAIPSERAKLSISAMKHGKDVMSDKPGCVSFGDLQELRQTVHKTGRIWSVDFSERFDQKLCG